MKTIKHRKVATIQQITQHFDEPLRDAAVKLKMSLSLLKKLCREFGFKKWPYRKVFLVENIFSNHCVDYLSTKQNRTFEVETGSSISNRASVYKY